MSDGGPRCLQSHAPPASVTVHPTGGSPIPVLHACDVLLHSNAKYNLISGADLSGMPERRHRYRGVSYVTRLTIKLNSRNNDNNYIPSAPAHNTLHVLHTPNMRGCALVDKLHYLDPIRPETKHLICGTLVSDNNRWSLAIGMDRHNQDDAIDSVPIMPRMPQPHVETVAHIVQKQ